MSELFFRIKEFYRFSRKETRDLIISIFVVTFAFAYNDPNEVFDLTLWLLNFVKFLIIVSVSLWFHISLQKVVALSQGNNAEFKMWPTGLIICFILSLLTGGIVKVIIPGGVLMHHMAIHRLGTFRYGLNIWSRGIVGMAGPVANLIIATLALMFSDQLGIAPAFFETVAYVNFLMLIFSLLPLPNMDGLHLFFASRLLYVFTFSTLLSYFLLSLVGVLSWIFALIIGGVCWLLFLLFFEGK